MDIANQLQRLPDAPQALLADEVLAQLDVSVAGGLDEDEVKRRLQTFGPNTIVSRRKASVLAVLLHQFHSPVVYLLGAAAALAFYFGELEEGAAIAAVLAVNALIGFVTEIRAARSIEALRALGTRSARVRRDGHTRLIPADELVPGDIVLVEGGDSIAADLRLVEASHLGADESTLTGESVAIDKSPAPVAADARIADRTSMLFKGTSVTRGSGTGVVAATGLASELGRISQLVEEAEPESSPLEKRLTRLSGQLVWATIVLTALIAGVGLTTGKDAFLMVEAAIALAVAAIPEGLPIVATLALARGMWRMARQHALIEHLSAVETLGATTVILTDKTGTLTENRMTVRRFWVPSGEIDLDRGEEAGEPSALADDPQLAQLLEIAVLCNDASLERIDEDGSGDPMEIALLRAGLIAGFERSALLKQSPVVHKHAFDTATKMMATAHRRGEHFLFAIKGAPEAVLNAAQDVVSEDGDVAMDDEIAPGMAATRRASRPSRLARAGLCHEDRPPSRRRALRRPDLRRPHRAGGSGARRRAAGHPRLPARRHPRCHGHGRSRGDGAQHRPRRRSRRHRGQRRRREACCANDKRQGRRAVRRRHLRPRQPGREARSGARLSGRRRDRRHDRRRRQRRARAETGRYRRRHGPARHRRGARGRRHDPARRRLPHHRQGDPRRPRHLRQYPPLRRLPAVVQSQRSAGGGPAILSTLPLPILPLQILYLNLVTDVFPAFALAMGEGDSDILKRPPRDPKEPILGRAQWTTIVLQSLAITAGTFGALALAQLELGLDSRSVMTVTFLTLAFAQFWHVFDMRHPRSHLLRNEITRNPWVWASLALCSALLIVPRYLPPLADVLHSRRPPQHVGIILALSLAPMLVTNPSCSCWPRAERGPGMTASWCLAGIRALRRDDRDGRPGAHPLRRRHRAADRPVALVGRAGAARHRHLAARTVHRPQLCHRRPRAGHRGRRRAGQLRVQPRDAGAAGCVEPQEPMFRRIDQGHVLTAGFGVVLIGFVGALLLLGQMR